MMFLNHFGKGANETVKFVFVKQWHRNDDLCAQRGVRFGSGEKKWKRK